MTDAEIVDRLVMEHRLNEREARDFVTAFFAEAKQMIAEDRPVRFAGFGTLKKVHGGMRNVVSGDPTRHTLKFIPAKQSLIRVQRAMYEDARQEERDTDRYAQYQKWLAAQNSPPSNDDEDTEEFDETSEGPMAA